MVFAIEEIPLQTDNNNLKMEIFEENQEDEISEEEEYQDISSKPLKNNVYEKVYTDEKDVILFWKTQMLYYVKTDRIFRSLPVEFDSFKFYFDASNISGKKANEKRSLIFQLKEIKEAKSNVNNA